MQASDRVTTFERAKGSIAVSGSATDRVETFGRVTGSVAKGVNGGQVKDIVEPREPNADTR